jgi:3-isopropylmalate/(R)-2-methylmalate dehydratase large subunit
VILTVIGKIGVNGATNRVIEFSGSTVDEMSMESRMTLCNMAIEAGATSGICSPDSKTVEYLWESIQEEYDSRDSALEAFSVFSPDDDAEYDEVIAFDAGSMEPVTTFGFKPDQVKPVKEMEGHKIDQVYIGSCTNGRIEDLRAAARELEGKKISDSVRGIVSPATTKIYNQALEEGIIKTFMDAGFCVTNPTCGACLGMSNGVLAPDEVCASTTNRNFNGRMGRGGMVHLMSPATAAASAVAGCITNSEQFKSRGNR